MNRYPWLIPAALVLLTLSAYANSFPGTFVLDDIHIAQHNDLVHNPDLVTIFTTDYWHGFENSGLFRPVMILSLALNRMLLGEGAWGFHLVNVLLHAGVVVMLRQLLLGWGVATLGATGAAVLFAVHPVHTEAINIIVGRNELLVACFLLLAFLLSRREGSWTGGGIALCYLLALSSKEHAITFVALLPLADAFQQGFGVWRRCWPRYAGLAAVAAGWLLWRYYFVVLNNPLPRFPVTEAAAPLAFVDPLTRILTALSHQWMYLSKLVFPYGLQSVYSINDLPPFITAPWSWPGLLVMTASGVAVAALVWGWRTGQVAALCGVLFIVSFLPTSNLFFATGATFAERLAYLPSLWYCAGVGVLLASLAKSTRTRQAVMAGLSLYALLLTGVLLARNPDYANELSLWSAEVEENPRDFLGWQSLAESYNNQKLYVEADNAYRTMLQLAPDYPGGLRSRTNFFMNQGRYDLALETAAKVYALSQAQNDPIAMAFDGMDLAEVKLGLGSCQEGLELLDGPSAPLRESLRGIEVRAVLLACLNRHAEAVDFFARVEGEPKEHRIAYHFGKSLFQLSRLPEARMQLEKAVTLNEGDAEAWNLLGVVCAELKDWPAAIAAMERAATLAPDRSHYRENLERARKVGR